jgi:hypothetical protein
MLNHWGWNKERIALSVRVGAVVAVLGFVLLAVEQRLVQDVSPQEIVTTRAASSGAAAAPITEPAAAPAAPGADYFPAHFPPPMGEAEPQPPTF